MKFFKRLLVAPAALGLLAPLAANATEANMNEVSTYSKVDVEINTNSFKPLTTKNPLLLSGGEGMYDNSSDYSPDTFSATTQATFSANFVVNSVDGVAAEDTLGAVYDYAINLTTTFTGDDALDVSLAGGDGGGGRPESDLTDTGDIMMIDGLSYTFPLGEKTTVFVGHNVDGSTLYNTACLYGGPTNAMDDCGVAFSNLAAGMGVAGGLSYDVGNGLLFSLAYEGNDGANGIMTKEGSDAIGTQVAYIKDTYGVSLSYLKVDANWFNLGNDSVIFTGLNAYYDPDKENFPSISVGYEWTKDESSTATAAADEAKQWFLGVQWDDWGPGIFGAAIGPKAQTTEGADEEMQYEAFYDYPVNDSITVTPVIYQKENSAANTDDETGLMVKTSFSF